VQSADFSKTSNLLRIFLYMWNFYSNFAAYLLHPAYKHTIGHYKKVRMKRKQDTSFRVEAATELMPFLLAKMGGMTRTSIKQLLSQRRVTVNAGIQTRHDTPLKPGDVIQILPGRGNV
jgi:RNA-binding protein YlmH